MTNKYRSFKNSNQHPCVNWTGFAIPVITTDGANCLVDELNRLNDRASELQRMNDTQAATINSLRSVHADLKERLAQTRESRRYWRGLVHRSRKVLGEYLVPGVEAYTKKGCIDALLDILDNAQGIARERGSLSETERLMSGANGQRLKESIGQHLDVSVEEKILTAEAGHVTDESGKFFVADGQVFMSEASVVGAGIEGVAVSDGLQEAIKETGYLVESFPTSSAFKEHLAILLTEQRRRLGIPEDPTD